MVNKKGTNKVDHLVGTDGDDKIYSYGANDTIDGKGGNDTLNGGHGDDLIAGGNGNDRIDGDIGNDTLKGGSGRDNMNGNAGLDRLEGGSGDDFLDGGSGNDTLAGGTGNDQLFISIGSDKVDGGSGYDFLDFWMVDKALKLTVASSGTVKYEIRDYTAGETYQAKTVFAGIEGVSGSYFNDKLTGNKSANLLHGYAGDDRLSGMGGSDKLEGGEGRDTLTGGAGKDYFWFTTDEGAWNSSSRDNITDFDPKSDVLVFDSSQFAIDGTGKVTQALDSHVQHIKSSEFVALDNPLASGDDVHVIYDRDNGLIYYKDADLPQPFFAIADVGKFKAIDAHDILLEVYV